MDNVLVDFQSGIDQLPKNTKEEINKEIEGMKKMFGQDFFLCRPSKFTDWDMFIKELKDNEGIVD